MSSYSLRSTFATLPRTTRGRPIVVGADPKAKNFLYTNGNSVIIRDVSNPTNCDIYTEHAVNVNVAQYSPSRFYIASGDVNGKIRIWDTVNPEHCLAHEYQPLGGAIKDIAWSPDSKRIVVGGDGREKFGHVFLADSGSSVGEIMGHSKSINSCDYKPSRPYKIVTAGEDQHTTFLEGPPFKFTKMLREHTNFVNCVRYSHDGDKFITGGADGKVFVYDGKSADNVGELGCPAHKAGVYALCYSPDNSQILTVSADKTAKLWDANTYALLTEFTLGKTTDDMQVGCVWVGDSMITISLSGYINYLDKNNPEKPMRVLKGHNKPIMAMTFTSDGNTIFTGCSSGHINYWDANSGLDDEIVGKGHSTQIQDLTVSGDNLISVSMDDTIRFTSISSKQYGTSSIKLESQPRAVANHRNLTAVACINHVVLLDGERVVLTERMKFESSAIAFHPNGGTLAVGGDDNKVHLYEVNNFTLIEIKSLEESGSIKDISFSPDGQYMTSCNSDRRVNLYSLPDYSRVHDSTHHTARVNSVSWSPDSTHFVTGGIDSNIIVHNPKQWMAPLIIKGAHKMSQVNRVLWLNDNVVISVGQDSNVKQWNINHH